MMISDEVKRTIDSLIHRIDELESEITELRPFRDGYDPEERLPERSKNVPDSSVNVLVAAIIDKLDFVEPFYVSSIGSYDFLKNHWIIDYDTKYLTIIRWYPLPGAEIELVDAVFKLAKEIYRLADMVLKMREVEGENE